jgi:hypothetical protein
MKRHTDLDIGNLADARALYAFDSRIPCILHTGIHGIDLDTSFLTAIKDFPAWNAPTTGVRARIVQGLQNFNSIFLDRINSELECEDDELMRSLATTLLATTVSFITSWIAYIDATMKELTEVSKFSQKKAWSMVTRISNRMFRDMHAVRATVIKTVRAKNQRHTCALMLWGVLRTHDVMEAYTKSSFQNHTSVSNEYIKFFATNSGFDAVKTLKDDVDAIKKESASAAKKADTASNKGDDFAKKELAELKRELAELKRELKTVKK